MDDVSNECILEVFDFFKKNVFCCSINEERLNGLINRGAVVWADYANKTKILAMKTYPSFKDNINFINNDFPKCFDYSIVSDFKHEIFSKDSAFFVKEHIVILAGILDLFKWYLVFKKVFGENNTILYSVVPSIGNTRLVIPETFNVPFERYWTLRSKNPFMSIKLIAEWVFIKNNLVRRLFSDKLIVIKC